MEANSITEQEQWRPVVGYEDYYEVSNLGNIRRKKSKRLRKIDYAPIYPTILFSVKEKHTTYRVHRIVAKAFLKPIEGKTHVNHKDGNHSNNRVDNLEWCTQKENNLHSFRVLHRKSPFCYIVPWNKKIYDEDLKIIVDLYSKGEKIIDISKRFGIHESTLRKRIKQYLAKKAE